MWWGPGSPLPAACCLLPAACCLLLRHALAGPRGRCLLVVALLPILLCALCVQPPPPPLPPRAPQTQAKITVTVTGGATECVLASRSAPTRDATEMARPVGDSVGELILILSMTRCSLPTAKASAAWPPGRCCLPAAARGLPGFCPVFTQCMLTVCCSWQLNTRTTLSTRRPARGSVPPRYPQLPALWSRPLRLPLP